MKPVRALMFHTGLLIAVLFSMPARTEPQLNGLAVHSELGKEQFIAGLYHSELTNNANDILGKDTEKRIQVRILADRLSSRRFKRFWIEGMAINATSAELAKYSQSMADFSNFLKIRLINGDVFTVDRSTTDITVRLNGSVLGVIDDATFFDVLLLTWIGPVPLSSDFRDNLLAQGKLSRDLEARYAATQPTEERIQFVAESLKPAEVEVAQETTPPQENNTNIRIPSSAAAPAAPSVAAVSGVKEAASIVGSIPPEPKLKQETTPENIPQERQVAVAKPRRGLLNESLLDDDEEDIEFTAAGLLAESLYISKLKRWTNRYIKYPPRALDKGWEGNVRLLITIDRSGELQNYVVTEKPKYGDLEKAALKAVRRANPFPAMPSEVRGKNFKFSLPIVFVLR